MWQKSTSYFHYEITTSNWVFQLPTIQMLFLNVHLYDFCCVIAIVVYYYWLLEERVPTLATNVFISKLFFYQ